MQTNTWTKAKTATRYEFILFKTICTPSHKIASDLAKYKNVASDEVIQSVMLREEFHYFFHHTFSMNHFKFHRETDN